MGDYLKLIEARIQESINWKKEFINQADNIEKASNAIVNSLKNRGQVLIFGNGGSAADAQHIAGELVCEYLMKRKALSARALTTDASVITAWSNDNEEGFKNIFARQIEAYAKKGDILLGISTSGNSINVVNALLKGKEIGTINISLTGKDGGKLKEISDININSYSRDTPRIQECHEIAYHTICEIVEKEMNR